MLPLLLLGLVAAQDASFTCEQSSSTSSQTYNKGDSILVCIFFSQGKILTRIPYQLTVDQYSAIVSDGAYTAMQGQLTTLQVSVGSLSAQYQSIYINNPTQVFTQTSIVIQMYKGTVTGLFWDNTCFSSSGSCASNGVDGNTSSGFFTNYVSNCGGSVDCDPIIYVSFYGSDAQGQYFTSSGLRMSQFTQYNTASMYNSAQNAVYSATNSITSATS